MADLHTLNKVQRESQLFITVPQGISSSPSGFFEFNLEFITSPYGQCDSPLLFKNILSSIISLRTAEDFIRDHNQLDDDELYFTIQIDNFP